MHKHKNNLERWKIWDGVGEAKAVAGLDLGPAQGRSVTYRLGRDPAGCSASAEASDEDLADGGATPTIRGSARVFHGFKDGGGHTQDIATDFPTRRMVVQDTAIPT